LRKRANAGRGFGRSNQDILVLYETFSVVDASPVTAKSVPDANHMESWREWKLPDNHHSWRQPSHRGESSLRSLRYWDRGARCDESSPFGLIGPHRINQL